MTSSDVMRGDLFIRHRPGRHGDPGVVVWAAQPQLSETDHRSGLLDQRSSNLRQVLALDQPGLCSARKVQHFRWATSIRSFAIWEGIVALAAVIAVVVSVSGAWTTERRAAFELVSQLLAQAGSTEVAEARHRLGTFVAAGYSPTETMAQLRGTFTGSDDAHTAIDSGTSDLPPRLRNQLIQDLFRLVWTFDRIEATTNNLDALLAANLVRSCRIPLPLGSSTGLSTLVTQPERLAYPSKRPRTNARCSSDFRGLCDESEGSATNLKGPHTCPRWSV